MTASLRIQSSKADSNTCESFTRSGLKLESVHQESPRSDVFRKRATKPLMNQRQRQKHLTWAVEKKNWTVVQWSKVLFSDESKFCISFGNQGPRVWRKSGEAQNPCCLKSSVKFPQSVMIWAATLQTRPPSSVDADAPCECSVSQSARTHTSHTGCVCALRSLGHGCVQEVKNDINTVRFLTQTARFVS